MRFFWFSAVFGLASLASIWAMPDPTQAQGGLYACWPTYSTPAMYYSQPYQYQPSYAPRSSAAQPTRGVTVGAYDNYFAPNSMTIQPGMTVRWVNYGRHTHTVTSNDGSWGSGDILPGASYSATFAYPGTYSYYCRYHTKDNMRGIINVGSGSTGPSSGYGGPRSSGSQNSEAREGSSPDNAELVRYGDYLVNEVAHCSHCHTPQDSKGQLDRSRLLQGTTLPIVPKQKTENWADRSPDITSNGLAGKLSEEQLIKFLMTGVDPNGNHPRPPMPIFHLHARDARAVVLYLKSLPGAKGGGTSDKESK